jgi:hypothetical protein
MKKKTLLQILVSKHVPESSYSLNGIKDGECLCIIKEDSSWKIVHNSRGKITFSESCADEEECYERFYEIMKHDYGWNDI